MKHKSLIKKIISLQEQIIIFFSLKLTNHKMLAAAKNKKLHKLDFGSYAS